MLRADTVVRRPAVDGERVADTLTLDHGRRLRRRLAMTTDGGVAFLLDLDRATLLDEGDALELEDGRLVRIRAAPERLVEVRAGNSLVLKRIIWHLGNRHVPAEIADNAIFIAEDHVLMDMVRGLGATAVIVERPFRPERGAYEDAVGPAGAHGHSGHPHE